MASLPGYCSPPGQLAFVSVLQYVEGLSDRQAADAVRGRIDWKYALGLELRVCESITKTPKSTSAYASQLQFPPRFASINVGRFVAQGRLIHRL